MATSDVIANLQTAQSSLAAAIATFSDASLGPNITVGGVSVDRTGYVRSLREELAEVTKQLMQLQPYSVQSQVL